MLMYPEEQKSDEVLDQNEEVLKPESQETGDAPEASDETGTADAQLKAEQEKYLRLYSEFENFRKRTSRERLELLQMAGKDVILNMLPVLDDFERALKTVSGLKEQNADAEGFELIYKKMLANLETMGLKAMDSVGKPFDVELHEAITKIPAGDDKKGMVVDEAEKGYMLNDKVIRFAKVVVGE